MARDAYLPQTPKDLKAMSKHHNGIQVISQLGAEAVSPASKWNSRHLVAYRLLTHPQDDAFLEVFKADHDAQCPLCTDDQPYAQKIDHTSTNRLIGQNPRGLCEKSESELMRLPDGFFWVALARAANRPGPVNGTTARPNRNRKQVDHGPYVSSTSEILDSSPPTQPSSSSSFGTDSSNIDVDEDEHGERGSKPEEVTVHLITSFLQYALSLCLLQRSTSRTTPELEVRARIERIATTASIAGNSVAAEDNGGICLMRQSQPGWTMKHAYMALVEAKRAFRYIQYHKNSDSCVPVVSRDNLAQYLGEAVITWKGNSELLQNDIFLIAATSTFVQFIHFRFGRDYKEYLNIEDGESQVEFVNSDGKDAFVYMRSTRFFNLQSAEGRQIALCHVLALLRWHDARGIRHMAAANEEGDERVLDENFMDVSD
ncbi:hypothetical protein B0T19DRAFT_413733 [Cercophora scortea]|uniref:Uncharacterized protein n=1 Tax=Cercophora scortea TaxID=314031 RepID=A0AAE0IV04_9PEZI|nr:hypothetical protein B0T19DRAFT_413733 [Cercophora scortea]